MKSKRNLIWLCLAIIGILLMLAGTAFIMYRIYFNGEITTDHDRWAEFGDYVSGIAGILNVVAFVGLTIVIEISGRERKNQEKRIHAETIVHERVLYEIEQINELYILFLENYDRKVAQKSLEILQPFMSFLYFLKASNFLPEETKKELDNIHKCLFGASDILNTYAYELEEDSKKQVIEVLKTYRELTRKLSELEVIVLADIASGQLTGEENYVNSIGKKRERYN